MAKTVFKMQYATNIWPAVEQWADGHHYRLEAPGESMRLYARISQDTNSNISVAISQNGGRVEINAWYSDVIRTELKIDATSLYAALPRKEALAEIQALLAALDYRPQNPKKAQNIQKRAFNLGRSIRKLSGKK
jgi:hypothetical protein